MGIPPAFIALFVVVLLAGVAMSVYRLSVVRDTARKAGLDPDEATRMALLDDDGVSTAYLAARLQSRGGAASATPPRSAADRLQELDELKANGLVTEQEYADRRTAILDSI